MVTKVKPIFARTSRDLTAALRSPVQEANVWQVQSALLGCLKAIVRRRGITHAEIARLAGTSRTRVTAILNDNLEHVSIDLLVRILGGLGYAVKVSVVKRDTAA